MAVPVFHLDFLNNRMLIAIIPVLHASINQRKKRSDFPQLPTFAPLGDEKLRLIAEYMLETASGARSQ